MIRIKRLAELSQEEYSLLSERSGSKVQEVRAKVKAIIDDVRDNRDQAVKKYTRMFDQCDLGDIRVSQVEVQAAYAQVSRDFIKAMESAIENSRKFERSICPIEPKVTIAAGIEVWREWRPIEKVGLYIPGGKARYPSSLVMTAVPAQIAGCREFVVCTPPDERGKCPASTLVACDLTGVTKIFKIGGAQAIAAMAYGTESVPQVYKIFGAGNVYVTAAKLLAYGQVDIDMPAGPSEIMILADDQADPRFVAADLLSQAEHDESAASILLTDSLDLACSVRDQINEQAPRLASFETIKSSLSKFGIILLLRTLGEGVDFINDYAPEHLEIVTRDDEKYLAMTNNVGSVFLGSYSTEAAGDYASGSNHVLPTSGYAKMFSPLSTESFGRKIQVQRLSKKGLSSIRGCIASLAEEEGLPAHRNASEIRFADVDKRQDKSVQQKGD